MLFVLSQHSNTAVSSLVSTVILTNPYRPSTIQCEHVWDLFLFDTELGFLWVKHSVFFLFWGLWEVNHSLFFFLNVLLRTFFFLPSWWITDDFLISDTVLESLVVQSQCFLYLMDKDLLEAGLILRFLWESFNSTKDTTCLIYIILFCILIMTFLYKLQFSKF